VLAKSEAETVPEAPVQSGAGMSGIEKERVGADHFSSSSSSSPDDELELE